jgi:hypothetical protein
MTITYTLGIPNAPNNPSNDQPNMKVNNDANSQIWSIDHVTFASTPAGTHNHVTFANSQSNPGLAANTTQIYPKSFGNATTYLETYTAANDSTGINQINGYLPFVKAIVSFTTLGQGGGNPTIITTNTLNANVASITQSAGATATITVTFTNPLPYNTYYIFSTVDNPNISSAFTKNTTNFSFTHLIPAAGPFPTFYFMVI